jgi:hypothetical protein
MEGFSFKCAIADTPCEVFVQPVELGLKGQSYRILQNGKFCSYIHQSPEGLYRAVDDSTLTQDDVDALGEYIDAKGST